MATYHLTGAGTVGLSANVSRLIVDVTIFNSNEHVGSAIPPNYYKLGLLRFGVQGSYGPVFAIDAASIYADCPEGLTTLGYSLFGTTAITVTEQFAQPGMGGSHVAGLTAFQNIPNDGQTHTMVTYTVPTGHSALLELVQMGAGLASSSDSATLYCLIDDAYVIYETVYGPLNLESVGTWWDSAPVPNPLHLFAGETVSCAVTIGGTASPIACLANLRVIEYSYPAW